MGNTYDHIPEKYIEWIKKQEVFWVATAPLAADGHVNVSPKGLRGSLVVEGPNKGEEVVYTNLVYCLIHPSPSVV